MFCTYQLLLSSLLQLSLLLANNDQCSIRDSCSNSSNRSPSIDDDELFIQSRNCFCDSICEEYGDCCDQLNPISTNYQCVDFLLPTMNNKTALFSRLSVWMRTECLPIYRGSQVENFCRNGLNETFNDNPILFIPVTSLRTNITYRNFFCAYCNNDMKKDIQFWEYKPFCYGDGSENSYLTLNSEEQVDYYIHNLTKNCTKKTILYPHERGSSTPSAFIRPCKQSLPSICPIGTPKDLAENCSSFGTAYRYVPRSDMIYRNSYCAQCQAMENLENLTCLDPALRSSTFPMTQIRINPLSILFDPILLQRYLNNQSNSQSIYSMEYNCSKPNELYNLIEKRCSQISQSHSELILSMKCSHLMETSIQSNETISYDNGSLYLINLSVYLSKDQYYHRQNDRILFCGDAWLSTIKPSSISLTFPFYRHILSIISTSISLLCLLIFIIIFFLISSLHNLPGKCLLLLSMSLFLGQLTFISISNYPQYHSMCLISSILIHYFYLASFFWLLIISLNIYFAFHQQTLPPLEKTNDENLRFLLHNILVWCSTGVIIFIACLIQFFLPQSTFSPGYGLVFCSISKVNSMILFFLVPIGCSLLIVMILFIRTLVTISRSHQMSKFASVTSSSKQRNRNFAVIYARLACLMGMQWILLIIALIIRQTWSWIIFEIINSLPGLFICMGFLCSKRVFNNFKEKISINSILRPRSSRSNTTTSTTFSSPTPATSLTTKKFHF